MKINLVCLEDGIISCGFRKMASLAKSLNPNTKIHYVSLNQFRGYLNMLLWRVGEKPQSDPKVIDEIAHSLADCKILGFSCMTGYSELAKSIMARVKEISPQTYIIWGGIHPIINPEDAIQAPVDAICTGEGEQAFTEFLDLFQKQSNFSEVKNFWFKSGSEVKRNGFRPLMSATEMTSFPFPHYGEEEWIYEEGRGFVPLTKQHYLDSNGLSYSTVWSIGCPFHCTYCGNTVFLKNDSSYKKIRHPGVGYVIGEVKHAISKYPHISTILFHDDSFMALPFALIEEFAQRWKEEINLPFCVYGLIPNYVREDKFRILTWAGMNRVRMGVQSGSERILKFYKRPAPPARALAAAKVISSFKDFQVAPAYDIIVDNPLETRDDVIDSLEFVYQLPRPFTLNIYTLRNIPNSELEKQLKIEGIDIDSIDSNYHQNRGTWSNCILMLLTLFRPPKSIFHWMLLKVRAPREPQREFPWLLFTFRTALFVKRGLSHIRRMDFSTISGSLGYWLWKMGLVHLYQRTRSFPEPYANAVDPEPAPNTTAL